MDLKATIKDVFASIVGSAACVYTGQPFDTVKVPIAYFITRSFDRLLTWLLICSFTH